MAGRWRGAGGVNLSRPSGICATYSSYPLAILAGHDGFQMYVEVSFLKKTEGKKSQ
jgi:hypothetical protein